MKKLFVFAFVAIASLVFATGNVFADDEEELEACEAAAVICIACGGEDDCAEMAEWEEDDCAALVVAAAALEEEGLSDEDICTGLEELAKAAMEEEE